MITLCTPPIFHSFTYAFMSVTYLSLCWRSGAVCLSCSDSYPATTLRCTDRPSWPCGSCKNNIIQCLHSSRWYFIVFEKIIQSRQLVQSLVATIERGMMDFEYYFQHNRSGFYIFTQWCVHGLMGKGNLIVESWFLTYFVRPTSY